MKRFNCIGRYFLSVFLLTCLLFEQAIAFAPSIPIKTSPPQLLSTQQILNDPALLKIPMNHVSLKDMHVGAKSKLIIHIQDAHTNPSAQKNLAGAVDELVKTADIGVVFVEGASTDVSLNHAKTALSPKAMKLAADKLLYHGVISGEEHVSLTTHHDMKLIGIENSTLYRKNLSAYQRLVSQRSHVTAYWKQCMKAISPLRERLYPTEILEYEVMLANAADVFVDGNRGYVTKKLDYLLDLARIAGMPLRDESEINEVQALVEMQSSLESLTEGNVSDDTDSRVQVFRQRMAGLNYGELVREMDQLESRLYDFYLDQPESRYLSMVDDYIELLNQGAEVQLSYEAWQKLARMSSEVVRHDWRDFLNAQLEIYGLRDHAIEHKPEIEESLESILDFYALANERNTVFVDKASAYLAQHDAPLSILIAGGYHTQHLTELLKEQGYSYLVLTPHVKNETQKDRYEALLLASERGETQVRTSAISNRLDTVRPEASAEGGAAYARMALMPKRFVTPDLKVLVRAIGSGAAHMAGFRSKPLRNNDLEALKNIATDFRRDLAELYGELLNINQPPADGEDVVAANRQRKEDYLALFETFLKTLFTVEEVQALRETPYDVLKLYADALRDEREKLYQEITKAFKDQDRKVLNALNNRAIDQNYIYLQVQAMRAFRILSGESNVPKALRANAALRVLDSAWITSDLLRTEVIYQMGRLVARKKKKVYETVDLESGEPITVMNIEGFDIEVTPEKAVSIRQQRWLNAHKQLDDAHALIKTSSRADVMAKIMSIHDLYTTVSGMTTQGFTENRFHRYTSIRRALNELRSALSALYDKQLPAKDIYEQAKELIINVKEIIPHQNVSRWQDVFYSKLIDGVKSQAHAIDTEVQISVIAQRAQLHLSHYVGLLNRAVRREELGVESTLSSKNIDLITDGLDGILAWAKRGRTDLREELAAQLNRTLSALHNPNVDYRNIIIMMGEPPEFTTSRRSSALYQQTAHGLLGSLVKKSDRIITNVKPRLNVLFAKHRLEDIERRVSHLLSLVSGDVYEEGAHLEFSAQIEALAETYFSREFGLSDLGLKRASAMLESGAFYKLSQSTLGINGIKSMQAATELNKRLIDFMHHVKHNGSFRLNIAIQSAPGARDNAEQDVLLSQYSFTLGLAIRQLRKKYPTLESIWTQGQWQRVDEIESSKQAMNTRFSDNARIRVMARMAKESGRDYRGELGTAREREALGKSVNVLEMITPLLNDAEDYQRYLDDLKEFENQYKDGIFDLAVLVSIPKFSMIERILAAIMRQPWVPAPYFDALKKFKILSNTVNERMAPADLEDLPSQYAAPIIAQMKTSDEITQEVLQAAELQETIALFVASGGDVKRRVADWMERNLNPKLFAWLKKIWPYYFDAPMNAEKINVLIEKLKARERISQDIVVWNAGNQYALPSSHTESDALSGFVQYAIRKWQTGAEALVTNPVFARKLTGQLLELMMRYGLTESLQLHIGLPYIYSSRTLKLWYALMDVNPANDSDARQLLELWQAMELREGYVDPHWLRYLFGERKKPTKRFKEFRMRWNEHFIKWVSEWVVSNGSIRYMPMIHSQEAMQVFAKAMGGAEGRLRRDSQMQGYHALKTLMTDLAQLHDSVGLRYDQILQSNENVPGKNEMSYLEEIEPLLKVIPGVLKGAQGWPGSFKANDFWQGLRLNLFRSTFKNSALSHFELRTADKHMNMNSWREIAINFQDYRPKKNEAEADRVRRFERDFEAALHRFMAGEVTTSETVWLDDSYKPHRETVLQLMNDAGYVIFEDLAKTEKRAAQGHTAKHEAFIDLSVETLLESLDSSQISEPLYLEPGVWNAQGIPEFLDALVAQANEIQRERLKTLTYVLSDFKKEALDSAREKLGDSHASGIRFEYLQLDATESDQTAIYKERGYISIDGKGDFVSRFIGGRAVNLLDAVGTNYVANIRGDNYVIKARTHIPQATLDKLAKKEIVVSTLAGDNKSTYADYGATLDNLIKYLPLIAQAGVDAFFDVFMTQYDMPHEVRVQLQKDIFLAMELSHRYVYDFNFYSHEWLTLEGLHKPHHILNQEVQMHAGNHSNADSGMAIQIAFEIMQMMSPEAKFLFMQLTSDYPGIYRSHVALRQMGATLATSVSKELFERVADELGYDIESIKGNELGGSAANTLFLVSRARMAAKKNVVHRTTNKIDPDVDYAQKLTPGVVRRFNPGHLKNLAVDSGVPVSDLTLDLFHTLPLQHWRVIALYYGLGVRPLMNDFEDMMMKLNDEGFGYTDVKQLQLIRFQTVKRLKRLQVGREQLAVVAGVGSELITEKALKALPREEEIVIRYVYGLGRHALLNKLNTREILKRIRSEVSDENTRELNESQIRRIRLSAIKNLQKIIYPGKYSEPEGIQALAKASDLSLEDMTLARFHALTPIQRRFLELHYGLGRKTRSKKWSLGERLTLEGFKVRRRDSPVSGDHLKVLRRNAIKNLRAHANGLEILATKLGLDLIDLRFRIFNLSRVEGEVIFMTYGIGEPRIEVDAAVAKRLKKRRVFGRFGAISSIGEIRKTAMKRLKGEMNSAKFPIHANESLVHEFAIRLTMLDEVYPYENELSAIMIKDEMKLFASDIYQRSLDVHSVKSMVQEDLDAQGRRILGKTEEPGLISSNNGLNGRPVNPASSARLAAQVEKVLHESKFSRSEVGMSDIQMALALSKKRTTEIIEAFVSFSGVQTTHALPLQGLNDLPHREFMGKVQGLLGQLMVVLGKSRMAHHQVELLGLGPVQIRKIEGLVAKVNIHLGRNAIQLSANHLMQSSSGIRVSYVLTHDAVIMPRIKANEVLYPIRGSHDDTVWAWGELIALGAGVSSTISPHFENNRIHWQDLKADDVPLSLMKGHNRQALNPLPSTAAFIDVWNGSNRDLFIGHSYQMPLIRASLHTRLRAARMSLQHAGIAA